MGVPKFFRYISERYPCLSQLVQEQQIPEFDNLYLDMNGIIHMCSHPDDFDPHFRITEEKIFTDIFHYIEVLFRMIKPQKLFFMAVDGVAPRAKMNQQRGRRFRSAKDAETLEAKAREKGEELPSNARFDSNCITPGTVFMARLQEQLKYFVSLKISTDKLWQNCKVILSGQETPGEGEHKIMDYIRYIKSQPGYDPNTRHCLYGLDADLIMLGLCTHEPHFSLLREEVRFGRKAKRKTIPEQITFYLLHLSLMREYLELEFLSLKDSLPFQYDMEKIIDDWVLMGFLVGNDFIPHLPNLHIANGALPILYNAYMKILPTLDGYINEGGALHLGRFEKFMVALAAIDIEHFSEQYADLKYFQSKTGRRMHCKPRTSCKSEEEWVFFEEPVAPAPKTTNKELEALIKSTNDVLLEPNNDVDLLDSPNTSNQQIVQPDNKDAVDSNLELLALFLKPDQTDDASAVPLCSLPAADMARDSPEKWNEYQNKIEDNNENVKIGTLIEFDEQVPVANTGSSKPKSTLVEPSETNLEDLSLSELHDDEDDEPASNDYSDSDTDDGLMISEFLQHKTDYYMNKLDYSKVTPEVMRSQAEGYVRAIQWNLNYYYNGVCSWSWYYPHHYAPYISDIKGFADLKLEFDLGAPFKPFEQLLAVLPAASKSLLPEAYQELMVSEKSPIQQYYPLEFRTDLNGKKQEWEAVVLIPFIAEDDLLKAMAPCNAKLTEEEQRRNTHGPMLIYEYTDADQGAYEAPEYFPTIPANHAKYTPLTIDDIRVPPERLVKGPCPGAIHNVYYPGFPTFKHLKYTGHLEKAKVRVFDMASQNENMIITIKHEQPADIEAVANQILGKSVHVGWPHLVEALVLSVYNQSVTYKFAGPGRPLEITTSALNHDSWFVQRISCAVTQKERLGIDVGETSALVAVKVLIGEKYAFADSGAVSLEKQWATVDSLYPLQAVVKQLRVHTSEQRRFNTIQELFPVDSKCFMLGHPFYGSMAEVLDNVSLKNGRLKVNLRAYEEPDLSSVSHNEQDVKYMSGGVLAQRLAISPHLLSRITGSVFVVTGEKGEVQPRSSNKVNVGLNLKYNKKHEEIPGYSKRVEGQWLYSTKALQLVSDYMEFCPDLFTHISTHLGNDFFYESELFPNEAGTGRVQKISEWLKRHPYSAVERRKIGTRCVEPELVQKLERVLEEYVERGPYSKQVIMQVKPRLLYKAEVQTGHLPPDPAVTFRLYDRVVNVREGYTVPFGLKGIVVGIATEKRELGKADDELEEMFDIIFDKPFAGGLQMHTAARRGYHLPKSALINISHGERSLDEKSHNSAVSNAWFSKSQAAPPPPPRLHSNEPVPSHHSAFASCYPPNPGYHQQLVFMPPQRHGANSAAVFNPAQPHRMHPIRPQHQLQGPTAEFHALFNDIQKNHSKVATNPSQPGPPSSAKPQSVLVMPSSQAAHNLQTHKSIVPPKAVTTPPKQPVVDANVTAYLKKVLNIADKSQPQSSAPAPSLPTKSQAQHISVQDIFDHARSKEKSLAQSSKGALPSTVKLLMYCEAQHIDGPRYRYKKLENGFCAQVNLPFGRVVTGDRRPTEAEAAESAAQKAMEEIAQPSQCTSHSTIQLLSYCQAHRIGIPRYSYMTFDNCFCAQINLANGRVVTGDRRPTKEEAAENAAQKMMDEIAQNPRLVTPSQQYYPKQPYPAPSAAASGFPVPPKKWWDSQVHKKNEKLNFKLNQSSVHSKALQNTRANGPAPNAKQLQPPASEDGKVAAGTPFVPLQAVKQQRSKSGSISADNGHQKKNNNATSASAPNNFAHNAAKQVKPNSSPVKQQSSASAQGTCKAAQPQRRVRKCRIAANFSALHDN